MKPTTDQTIAMTIDARPYSEKKVTMHRCGLLAILCLLFFQLANAQPYVPSGGILYVDQRAGTGGDGSSWANAIPELADALRWARDQWGSDGSTAAWDATDPLKIFVAEGTYKPLYNAADDLYGEDGERDNVFVLLPYVEVYGGFAGTEASISDRSAAALAGDVYKTILSADFNGDDNPDNFDNHAENAYHVVLAPADAVGSVLDGFTISGGNADGGPDGPEVFGLPHARHYGGGLLNYSGNIIRNVSIIRNRAVENGYGYVAKGGGVYNSGNATYTRVTIAGNATDGPGGGMTTFGAPTLREVMIRNNSAGDGAGMEVTGSPNLINTVISGNTLLGSGSGQAGGIYADQNYTPRLINVTIGGNSGAAIKYGLGSMPISRLTLHNCIVWGGISGARPSTIEHSLIEGNSSTADGNRDATGLTAADIFRDPVAGDYRLRPGSLAINAGSNDLYEAADGDEANHSLNNDNDAAGSQRVRGGTIDMGAYESLYATISPTDGILYVDAAVDVGKIEGVDLLSDQSGDSWANAIPELADALQWAKENESSWSAGAPLKIYVAKGVYTPKYGALDVAGPSTNLRDRSFSLVNHVQLFGGFDPANDINDLNDQRLLPDPRPGAAAAGTILSGDFGDGSHAYHVVLALGSTGSDPLHILLDGFTISGGKADGSGNIRPNGWYTVNQDYGGGIWLAYTHGQIRHVKITDNQADYGGGIAMEFSGSELTLESVSICINDAGTRGGGIYTGSNDGKIRLTNTLVARNSAYNGGGMALSFGSAGELTMTNVTLSGNTVRHLSSASSGIAIDNGHLIIRNSIIDNYIDGAIDIAGSGNSLVRGSTDFLDASPAFVDGANGDYRLLRGSPAIGAGNNVYYTDAGGDLAVDADLGGEARLWGAAIDMGAFEYALAANPDENNILYVDKHVDGGAGDGSSWANAIPELRDALAWAAGEWDVAANGPLQVWVAKGTYTPVRPVDNSNVTVAERQATFRLVGGVEVYGGFAGGETTRDERDWKTNTTILSGDIDGNDTGTDGVITNPATQLQGRNSYHVVTASDVNQTALLDGFLITAGHADDAFSTYGGGGGVFNNGGHLALVNLTIQGNRAVNTGAGVLNGADSRARLTNVTIRHNASGGSGGGMLNMAADVWLTNAVIRDNNADGNGGGMTNSSGSTLRLTNTEISGNTAYDGGAMYTFGGSSVVLTNVTVTGNSLVGAGIVGGLYSNDATLTLANTVVWNNTKSDGSPDNLYTPAGTLVVRSSLLQGDPESWTWSTAWTGTDGGGNIITGSSPFADEAAGDYRLRPASQALNTGSNEAYESADGDNGNNSLANDTDLAGNPRVFRVADGGVVDIGAYESAYASISPTDGILYVNTAVDAGKGPEEAVSDQSGSSWANAIPELSAALQWAQANKNGGLWDAGQPLQLYVAEGEYRPGIHPTTNSPVTNEHATFLMVKDVQLYGGFPQSGDPTMDDRDWKTHTTTLKGVMPNGNPVYHAVVSAGDVGRALMDGFTITGAHAKSVGSITVNEETIDGLSGGGMINVHSSPTLTNLIVAYNSAEYIGGGVYNSGSSPVLANVTITDNSAAEGGGICNSASSPYLTNVIIARNTGRNWGGGISNRGGSPRLTNVLITGNELVGSAGGTGAGGGMLNSGSHPVLTNVTIIGNSAPSPSGSELSNRDSSFPTLHNSIVWGAVNLEGVTAYHSLIWGESTTDNGNIDASTVSDASVLFADPDNGDYRLLPGSPAIDAGSNAGYEAADEDDGNNSLGTDMDLAGNPRVTGLAADGIIDIGAYESPYMPIRPTAGILYVNTAVDTGKGPEEAVSDRSGSSWDNAIPELRDALRWAADNQDKGLWSAAEPLQIWVAGGKYTPVQPADPDNVTPSERGATFQLTSGLQLYGGFAGGETTLAERDWKTNVTILSGDIDGNDTGADGVITDPATEIQGANSYHVVTASGTDETTVLNGVTVTAGKADGPDADANGGGIYIHAGSPALVYVDIRGNRASNGGGAFHTASSNPRITNTIIRNNHAASGGGIYNEGSTTTLTNVVIARNTGVDAGGGMLVSTGSVTMNNSIAWRNVNGEGTLEHLKTIDGTMTSSHSMLEGFTKVVAWVSGWGWDTPTTGNDGGGNIIENNSPFVDEAAGDFSLRRLSLAVDAGSNALYEAADGDAGNNSLADDADLAGNPRVYDPVGRGIIDMGVSESPYVAIHPTNGILYVNAAVDAGKAPGDALSDQSGSSWENAMTVPGEIRQWLADRVECDLLPTPEAPLQVWVAKGVYTPATVSTDLGGFSLYNNVGYYGGFAGGETDLNQRDWKANTTILSGDIGGDDTGTGGIITDPVTQINGINSATLVTADDMKYSGSSEKINQSAVLDGFTLTAGYGGFGGAINIASGSPTLTNLDIRGNYAASGGGVAISRAVEPRFTNVAIRNNYAEADGGGMHVKNVNSSPEFVNVLISDNVADMKGGGIYSEENLSMTFTNVTITGNQAETGGGMFNAIVPSGSPVHSMNNVILWGNTAVDGPDIHTRFYMEDRTLTLNVAHSIFNKDGMVSTFQLFEVGEISDGSDRVVFNEDEPSLIVNQDPEFLDPAAGDYRLRLGSPAIDAGSNAGYEAADGDDGNNSLGTDVDLAGLPRVHSHVGIVDMGAYEYQPVEQAISEVMDVGKTYGEAPFDPGATANSGLPVSYASSDNTIAEAFEDADDGNKWKIRILKAGEVTITASQAGDSDYLPADDQTFTLTIAKRPVTVSFAVDAEITKEYDGTAVATVTASDLAFGAGEVVAGDELSVSLSSGAGSYSDKHAGTDKAVTLPLDGLTLGGADKDNYAISNNAPVTGDAGVITSRPLTITANNHTVLYSGTAYSGGNGVAYTGFVPGEDASVLSGTLTYSGSSQGAMEADTYTITPGGLTSSNYAVTFADGTLVISGGAANILSFNVQQAGSTVARTYGDGDVDGSAVASSGLTVTYGSSEEDVATIDANGQIRIKGVGTTILTASQGGNVNYAPAADISFSLEVQPKALTVTARNATRVYDGVPYSGGAGIDYNGFIPGEDASVVNGTLAYGGGSQGAMDVGSYAIIPSGLSAANYTIAYTDGRLDIVPAGGNVLTFDSQTAGSTVAVVYGAQALSAAARATSGLPVTYSSSNETAAMVSADGTVTVMGTGSTVITAGQPGDANHDPAADISFELRVSQKELTITANNDGKTYDGAAYSGGNGVQYTGFAYGEDESVLSGTIIYRGNSQGATDVGSYVIEPGGYTSSNYAIAYRNGSLSVTKRPVTVSFAAGAAITKEYDGTAVAMVTASDLAFGGGEVVAGDELSVSLSSGAGSYADKNAGTDKAVTLPLDGITLGGADRDNYAISNSAPVTGGAGVITSRPLSITANNHTVLYSGTAYSGGNGVVYAGFVPGEDASVLSGTLTYGGSSQGAVEADTYTITPGGLTSSNYAVTFADGTLVISGGAANILSFNVQQAGSTVARTYGEGDVDGSAVASSGLAVTYGSSDMDVAMIDANGQIRIRGVGTTTITASQGGNVNYAPAADISFMLEVQPKALTVTARNATKVYDGVPYGGGNGVAYTGFVPGEDESVLSGTVTYGGSSQGATDVGSYAIAPSGLSAANYTITYTDGRLDIVPAGGNVLTFDSQTAGSTVAVVYGAQALSAAARATSGLPVTYSSSNETAAMVSADGTVTVMGTGSTVITAGQPGDANHDPAADISFELRVSQKELTITANNDGKTYDGAAYSGGNGVQYTGFAYGEDESVLSGTLTYGGSSQGATDVGSYVIEPEGYTSSNYAIAYRNGSLSVTKRSVEVGFAADAEITKEYDGTAVATVTASDLAFGGGEVIAGDELSVNLSSGAGSYADKHAGTDKEVTLPLDGLTLGGADKDNYAISNNAPVTGDAGVITSRPLTITANNHTVLYSGGAYSGGNGVVYAGFVPGEDASVLGGALTYGGSSQGAVDVGSYTILPSGLLATNYAPEYRAGSLAVTPAMRTLDFPALPAKTYGEGDFDGGAVASSGEDIIYASSNPAVATVVAGLIRITGAGTATITATVPENRNYSSQPEVSHTLTVRKAAQTITLDAPAEVHRDMGSVPVTAGSSSGLPVTLAVDDPEVATLDGTSLNILRLGTVRITATQAGDANHEAAEPVAVTIRVTDPTSDMPIRIHRAVSPNGDGINEYLIIEAIKDYPENRVRIFNRNGTVVYEASGYNNGTVAFRGIGTGQQRVPAGTYFYVAEIRVGGEWKYEKGWFVLRY
ncbi:MBG domain-containing protein [Parapedobacter sp. 2B3]|uniref:MBG domain-containing protein n=1 Tax=Parapedobacter sp. 2B3 TaxID=3342381 RepID=UPI0035B6955F